MLIWSRRRFLAVASCAPLLYGARPAMATESATPTRLRLALLLPLNSSAFARPADFVRQGFAVAAEHDTG